MNDRSPIGSSSFDGTYCGLLALGAGKLEGMQEGYGLRVVRSLIVDPSPSRVGGLAVAQGDLAIDA
jgi:hypothetical protein